MTGTMIGSVRRAFFRPFLASVSLAISGAASAGEFSKPTNTVGDANCFGELQFTSHLGAVELSRNEVYDFHYTYSSFSEYDSPHLGKGFFVPMLEAKLIDNDYFLELTTLGGGTIFVYRLPADPDRFVSLNGKDIVRKLGDDSYERRTDEGVTLNYRLGKLTNLITPKGTRLDFDYDGDFCTSIRSSTGGVVCSMTRVNAMQQVFSTARGRYELGFQIHPFSEDGELHPEGLPPLRTLETIVWPNRATTRFAYPENEAGGNEVTLKMSYNDQSMTCRWLRYSGKLLSADDVDYQISPLNRVSDYSEERIQSGAYTIHRTFPDGTWKRFFHDEDAGYSDYEDSEGESFRTHYISTRGKVFNYVRKRERLPTQGGSITDVASPEVYYEAFYDTEGNLIREVNEDVVTWYIRKDGLPESVVKQDDNLVRFDDRNRVIYSRQGETVTETQWQPDGSSRILSQYPWGEITIHYFDDTGKAIPVPNSEKFPERNSL